jgi:hypothetical protein
MGSGNTPAPCDKGTYSTGGTEAAPNAVCTACNPGYSTQEDESTLATDCAVCAPGYGGITVNGNAVPCGLCPYGTYASGGAKAGDSCQDCAAGSTSKRGATQVQQCYPTKIDARNDVFNLADEAQWNKVDGVTAAEACATACTGSATCAMYKFVGPDGADAVCSTLVEVTTGATTKVGFKIGNGDDYSVWGTTTKVGAAVASPTGITTEADCRAACSGNSECEVYNWVASPAACTLSKSELEESAISMFQVRGDHLASDSA